MNHWHVLTGGQYAGKTTLINALQELGYMKIPETARIYIQQEFAKGKTIDQIRGNPIGFQREVLRMQEAIERTLDPTKQILFDRGMHDNQAYFEFHGYGDDKEMLEAVSRAEYKKVFLLDMISYVPDGVRTETPEQAKSIHEQLGAVYKRAGIPLVNVPVLPLPERVEFILSHL